MLIATAVRQGDTVVDVGANRGMFALTAVRQVGSAGRIICFEPNPKCVDILERDLHLNSIDNVTVYNVGLSDENAELTLSIPHINHGEATFGFSTYLNVDKIAVPVRVGDDMLHDVTPTVIKIDVEGYEPRVLKGLKETITKARPVIVTEVIRQHLCHCGFSLEELSGLMGKLGYNGFRLSVIRTGLHFRLRLTDDYLAADDCDVAWLHPDSPVAARLRAAVG
jgi:FkbM family methyltransferase